MGPVIRPRPAGGWLCVQLETKSALIAMSIAAPPVMTSIVAHARYARRDTLASIRYVRVTGAPASSLHFADAHAVASEVGRIRAVVRALAGLRAVLALAVVEREAHGIRRGAVGVLR